MKHFTKVRTAISGLTLGAALLVGSIGNAYAAPSPHSKPASTPPFNTVSGAQAKAPIEAGSVDASSSTKLGDTKTVKVDAEGKLQTSSVSTLAGTVSDVNFASMYNYCYRNLTYTPVRNTSSVTKYIHVQMYTGGGYRDFYMSVAAGATVYPTFYGVHGAYTAYLYVWNGSSYQYDEYASSNNTCNVSVTRTYNASGWVQLKIQNLGTAYASQQSTELAPFPASGTYTGTHYDYPAAGGAAIYRWFWVGTSPYGIVSDTLGSFNSPYMFTGDL